MLYLRLWCYVHDRIQQVADATLTGCQILRLQTMPLSGAARSSQTAKISGFSKQPSRCGCLGCKKGF